MRALAFLLSILVFPRVAQAQAAKVEPFAEQPGRSLWHESWPTFSVTEGIATVSAGLATGALELRAPPSEPRWQGGILFDNAVRRGLRAESASARHVFRRIGDMPYYAAPLLPLIVDPLLVSLAGRGDGKTALNLELIGLEAFSYAGLLSFVSTRLSLRDRPDATQCRIDHPNGDGCSHDTESFWSGHSSIVGASAGLVCASHQYLPLWGSPVADAGACALAATGALVTAVTRVIADRHYASDVIVGGGLGFGFGYAVPVLLHFARKHTDLSFNVQPERLGTGASVTVGGAF